MQRSGTAPAINPTVTIRVSGKKEPYLINHSAIRAMQNIPTRNRVMEVYGPAGAKLKNGMLVERWGFRIVDRRTNEDRIAFSQSAAFLSEEEARAIGQELFNKIMQLALP